LQIIKQVDDLIALALHENELWALKTEQEDRRDIPTKKTEEKKKKGVEEKEKQMRSGPHFM
jgi:hypothetical protein